MKKSWHKPKLVVLTRGRPEEYVLAACKALNNPEGGRTAIQTGSPCQENLVACAPCAETTGS